MRGLGLLWPPSPLAGEGWATAARLQDVLLVRRPSHRRVLFTCAHSRACTPPRPVACPFLLTARPQADSPQLVHDLLTATVLAEAIYKRPESECAHKAALFRAEFPPGLVPVKSYQLCRDSVDHRYLLAASEDALYVSFIGTKFLRDLVADVTVVQAPFKEAGPPSDAMPVVPRCHRGFLTRARAIPIVHLYAEARRTKRRLVLCGHSLGGAVAAVAALRLLLALRDLPSSDAARARAGLTAADDAVDRRQLRVMCFAQPAIGDAALCALVQDNGWDRVFHTLDVPEDIIPRLLRPRVMAASKTIVAAAAGGSAPGLDDAPATAASPATPWHRTALDRVASAVPTLPDYRHIGRRLLLLSDAVVSRSAGGAAATSSEEAVEAALAREQQLHTHHDPIRRWEWAQALQTRFLDHKMRTYRGRMAHIITAALPDVAATVAAQLKVPPPPLPSARIAPRMGPLRCAVALAPLTLCPVLTAASNPAGKAQSSGGQPEGAQAQQAAPPATVTMLVEVRGNGLGMASRVRVTKRSGTANGAALAVPATLEVPFHVESTPRRRRDKKLRRRTGVRCRVTVPAGDAMGAVETLPPMRLSVASDFEDSEAISIAVALRHVHLIDAGASLAPGQLARLARALAAADAKPQVGATSGKDGAAPPPQASTTTSAAVDPSTSAPQSPPPPLAQAAMRTALGAITGAASLMSGQLRAAAGAASRAVPWLPQAPALWRPGDGRADATQPQAALPEPDDASDVGYVSGRGVCFHWVPDTDPLAAALQRQMGASHARRIALPKVVLPPQVLGSVTRWSRSVRTVVEPPLQAAAAATAPLRRALAARLPPPPDVAAWPPVMAFSHGIASARLRLQAPAHNGGRPHALVLVSDAHAPAKATPLLARSRGVPVIMAYVQQPSAAAGTAPPPICLADPVAGISAALASAALQPASALVLLHSHGAAGAEPATLSSAAPAPPSHEMQATSRAMAHIASTISDRLPSMGRRPRAAAPPATTAVEATPDGWAADGSGIQPAGVAALRHAVHAVLLPHDGATLAALVDAADAWADDDGGSMAGAGAVMRMLPRVLRGGGRGGVASGGETVVEVPRPRL